MVKRTLTPIGTPTDGPARPLSKGQKAFNTLVERIGKRREALAEWATFDTEFQRKYNNEFVPLLQQYNAVRIELVTRLDQLHGRKGLTKTERQTIADLLLRVADELARSIDDPVVEEILRRYDPVDPEVEAATLNDIRESMSAMFGVEIGDEVDMSSPEDVMRHVQEKLDGKDEREREHQQARDEYHAKRKKTPKQSAAAERARTERDEVNLSIREVYRKLASALHPDREADPVERERKAALMQKVNVAYGKKSLLDLLELQLELEHIDQSSLDNVSEERLKRWNTILKEQLHQLDEELVDVQMGFLMRSGMAPTRSVSPKTVKRSLAAQMTGMRQDIRVFEKDLRLFDDPSRLKSWLKEIRKELAEMDYDDLMF